MRPLRHVNRFERFLIAATVFAAMPRPAIARSDRRGREAMIRSAAGAAIGLRQCQAMCDILLDGAQ